MSKVTCEVIQETNEDNYSSDSDKEAAIQI